MAGLVDVIAPLQESVDQRRAEIDAQIEELQARRAMLDDEIRPLVAAVAKHFATEEEPEHRSNGGKRRNGARKRKPPGETRDAALLYLQNHGEATIPELADAIGVSKDTARKAVETLHKEGHARQRGTRQTNRGIPPKLYVLATAAG